MDRASNPGFRTWLKEKVDKCTDLEERMALSSLSQILEGVIERLGANAVFEEPIADAEFADGTSSSSTQAAADTPLDRAASVSVSAGFCAALNEFDFVLFRDKGRVCMYALRL
eukprot:13853-Heterococcus_DN1.PRE.1